MIGIALLFTAATYTLRMYLQLRYVTGGNLVSEDEPRVHVLPPSSSAPSGACSSASPRWGPAR